MPKKRRKLASFKLQFTENFLKLPLWSIRQTLQNASFYPATSARVSESSAPTTKLYLDLSTITRFSSKTDSTWQNHIFRCARQMGGSRHVAAALVSTMGSVLRIRRERQRDCSKHKWRAAWHLRSVSKLWLRIVDRGMLLLDNQRLLLHLGLTVEAVGHQATVQNQTTGLAR